MEIRYVLPISIKGKLTKAEQEALDQQVKAFAEKLAEQVPKATSIELLRESGPREDPTHEAYLANIVK